MVTQIALDGWGVWARWCQVVLALSVFRFLLLRPKEWVGEKDPTIDVGRIFLGYYLADIAVTWLYLFVLSTWW